MSDLLFPEEDLRSAPKPGRFVFEMSGEQLFENATGLTPLNFADAVIVSAGFAGSEIDREALAKTMGDRLVSHFMEDGDFAQRVGAAEDPRPELRELIVRWGRELGVLPERVGGA